MGFDYISISDDVNINVLRLFIIDIYILLRSFCSSGFAEIKFEKRVSKRTICMGNKVITPQ